MLLRPTTALRRAALAAALLPLAAGLAAAPASADPRLRFTAASPQGEEFGSAQPIALSAGARELLFNAYRRGEGTSSGYLRTLATGTTTAPLPSGTTWVAASDDLSTAIVSSTRALTADDKNTAIDGYLWQRATGKFTLLTRASTSGAALGEPFQATLSGDGKVAHFSYSSIGEAGWEPRGPFKYVVATGSVSRFGASGYLAEQQNADTAGNVVAGDRSVWVRGARTEVDYKGYEWQIATNAVADDGSAAAWRQEGNVRVFLTASKTLRDVNLGQGVLGVLAVSSGGNYVLVSFRSDDEKQQTIEWVNTRTGQRELATAAFATTPSMWLPQVVSPDHKYVAFRSHIAAIGSDPIPGAAITPTTYARWYFTYYPGCTASYWPTYGAAVRPSMVLNPWTVGSDPRVPASATVTVRVTSTGAVASQLTFKPGERKYLYGGYGGTTISGRVTFTDGSTGDFSERVNRYTPVANTTNPFNGQSECLALNGLQ